MAAEQVLDSGTLSLQLCVQSKAVFLLAYDEVGTTSANTIIIIHIYIYTIPLLRSCKSLHCREEEEKEEEN